MKRSYPAWDDVSAAVVEVIERVRDNPRQFPVIHKQVRRALLQGFPYALMFVIDEDGMLTILTRFHGSRDPANWQKRV